MFGRELWVSRASVQEAPQKFYSVRVTTAQTAKYLLLLY
jgi:hypothetical protein